MHLYACARALLCVHSREVLLDGFSLRPEELVELGYHPEVKVRPRCGT